MYEILKDFASPVVTLIGASIAGIITFTFARIQARIAKSQRDIAVDKLKFDLFQKRYEIYTAAKQLVEQVSLVSDLKKSDPMAIRALYVTIDEARFYFPPEIRQLLANLQAICERFFTHLAQRDQISIDNDNLWRAMAETLAADQSELRSLYASLPRRFETSLAFKQLTASE
jgi:hypothetical protein